MEVEYDKLSKNAFRTYRKFFKMSYGLKSMIKELEWFYSNLLVRNLY